MGLCGGQEGGLAAAFTEACIFDMCRAGPPVAISDCLMAWQTRVATTSAISAATKLVGPGCCRPVLGDYINLVQNITRNGCAMECASNTCNAFAISGCSSSSDQTCGARAISTSLINIKRKPRTRALIAPST